MLCFLTICCAVSALTTVRLCESDRVAATSQVFVFRGAPTRLLLFEAFLGAPRLRLLMFADVEHRPSLSFHVANAADVFDALNVTLALDHHVVFGQRAAAADLRQFFQVVDISLSGVVLQHLRSATRVSLRVSHAVGDRRALLLDAALCVQQQVEPPSGVVLCVRPLFGATFLRLVPAFLRHYHAHVDAFVMFARNEADRALLRAALHNSSRLSQVFLAPRDLLAASDVADDAADQELIVNKCLMRSAALGMRWSASFDLDEWIVVHPRQSAPMASRRALREVLAELPLDTSSVTVEMFGCLPRPFPHTKVIASPFVASSVGVHLPHSGTAPLCFMHRHSSHELQRYFVRHVALCGGGATVRFGVFLAHLSVQHNKFDPRDLSRGILCEHDDTAGCTRVGWAWRLPSTLIRGAKIC